MKLWKSWAFTVVGKSGATPNSAATMIWIYNRIYFLISSGKFQQVWNLILMTFFPAQHQLKTTNMLTNFCLTSSITMMHRPTVDLSQAVESAVQTFPTPTLKAWCHGVPKACRDLNDWIFRVFFPFEPSQLQKITQLENVAWKYWDSGIAGNWWDPVRLPASMKFLFFEVPSYRVYLFCEFFTVTCMLAWAEVILKSFLVSID